MSWYNDAPTMLYHSELGIPENVETQFGSMLLDYSKHALDASKNDQYGHIELPKSLDTSKAQVIEVETRGKKTTKVLYRIPYDEEYDLILAVDPQRRFVRTVWLNHVNDNHNTLDPTRYTIPA
jgi:hypothetical protein